MHHLPVYKLDLGGFILNIDISVFLPIILSCVIVFLIAKLSLRNLSVDKPSKAQNFIEWVVDFISGIVNSTMDFKKGKAFVSLGMALIMFIFVANMLGLPFAIGTIHDKPMPEIGITQELINTTMESTGHGVHTVWYKSPTADVSVTMGLALMVIVIAHLNGIRRNPKFYFKHYFEPFPFFLPLNILKQASKPITLGMRLFGNIYAGEILISVLIGAGAFGIPGLVVWQGFSIFVGAIQAFIFVMLTMVYVSMEIQDDHH
ncbi:F0F1 ATP synthase subunit A [Paenibacillus turpanensis]|uniref:F0F1 ATP synthase subunit A n=1 Tax=Paenibacillus turpanensis TaxID=2689078 RepID=UPI001407268C|nr:F0F1 ATP synthase subunit A [Paenibacillus turpanensis]